MTELNLYGRMKRIQKDALNYFASELFHPQMIPNLHVRVSFRQLEDCHGMVYVNDYNESGSARYFIIEVSKYDDEVEVLKTLAHEMIHVAQYVYKHLNEEMTKWKGKKIDADSIPYTKQPWEKEAREYGNYLYKAFVKQYNRSKR